MSRAQADSASGLVQAARHGRPWLWIVPIGVALAALGARCGSRRRQGTLLAAGALLALAGILIAGFSIGATGWSFDVLTRRLRAAAAGQPGIGIGGALALSRS